MSTKYRQGQQVIELERFWREGIGREMHPDPNLYGSGWGNPENTLLNPVREAIAHAVLRVQDPAEVTVVEIGCGGGRWTEQLSRCITTAHLTFENYTTKPRLVVIDGTAGAFALTSRHLENSHQAQADQEILCPDGVFSLSHPVDIVFSFDVFVHFDPWLIRVYLQSIAKALRPGGRLLINFGCEWIGAPEVLPAGWVRSDQWFEYVVRIQADGSHEIEYSVGELLTKYFQLETEPLLMPVGYGSAFFQFRRNKVCVCKP